MEHLGRDEVTVTYSHHENVRDDGTCVPVYYYEYCIDERVSPLARLAFESRYPAEYAEFVDILQSYDPAGAADPWAERRRLDARGEHLLRWFQAHAAACENFRLQARHTKPPASEPGTSRYAVRIASVFPKELLGEIESSDPAALDELLRSCSVRVPLGSDPARKELLSAVRVNPRALLHAGAAAWRDEELVLAMLAHDHDRLYRRIDPSLYASRQVALALVRLDPAYAFARIPAALRADRAFILDAVSVSPHALYFAPRELKDDREVALAAVRKCWAAFQYISERLKRDVGIGLTAVDHERSLFSGAWGEYVGSQLDK